MIEGDAMNYEYLNKMIEYIENNLDNEIDYSKLSTITNTNTFILERIFLFLTNMTINEYIKKRRLSKAFEEIRNTNEKIIDIAIKYQYNSASSFNRAFKQLFNITPSECRKKIGDYKIIPIEYFENTKHGINFDYEIKKLKKTTLYCFHTESNNYDDFLYNIRELFSNAKKSNYYENFNKEGMYGIYYKNNNVYHYYLGSKKHYQELVPFTIEEKEYALFRLNSRNQKDITNLESRINKQWIPSTSYNAYKNLKIELYQDNMCYIYLPIE